MKRVKHHPQYRLLEFLEETGITRERNISDFIVTEFEKPTIRISNEDDKGVQFLQSMLRRDLIKYNKGDLENVNNRYISTNPDKEKELPKWFDQEPVRGNITMAGLEYLGQHKINESIINSNDIISENSTIQTGILRRQKWVLWSSVIIAACSALIAYLSYRKDGPNNQLKQELKNTNQRIDSIRKELFQKATDSPIRKQQTKPPKRK
ncbi:MAG: hypothetical protein ACTHMI_23340 [Mucilaginibacter sp.]